MLCVRQSVHTIARDSGDQATIRGRNGNSSSYAYTDADEDGIAGEIETITDANGRVTEFHYTEGLVTSVEDSAGNVTTIAYDAKLRITSVTEPDPDGAPQLFDATGEAD